jgi:hypothetical protein
MPRSRKINLEKIHASLNTTCPKCGFTIEIMVEIRDRRVFLEDVVDHCVDFVGKEHPQLLADHLDAQSMDRADDGLVLAVEGGQALVDVVLELPSNDPVERGDEDVVAIDTEPLGMHGALYASHHTERFSGSRSRDATDGARIRVDEGRHLGSVDTFVP